RFSRARHGLGPRGRHSCPGLRAPPPRPRGGRRPAAAGPNGHRQRCPFRGQAAANAGDGIPCASVPWLTQVSRDESMPLERFAAPPFPRDLSMSAAPAFLTEGPSGRRGLPSACARASACGAVALQIPPKIWNNLPETRRLENVFTLREICRRIHAGLCERLRSRCPVVL